jgi:hypothetical protein
MTRTIRGRGLSRGRAPFVLISVTEIIERVSGNTRHAVEKCFPDSFRATGLCRRPIEIAGEIGAQRNDLDAWTQLWNAEFTRVQEAPICYVPKLSKLALQVSAVVLENGA